MTRLHRLPPSLLAVAAAAALSLVLSLTSFPGLAR